MAAPTAPTFGGNAGGDSTWVVDTNATQPLGGAVSGIGITGADGASIGASRLGGAPGTDIIVEVDGNLSTP